MPPSSFISLNMIVIFRVVQIAVFDQNAFLLSGTLSYVTLCLNPIIYASRYEAFRRTLKQILNYSTVD